MRWSKPGQQRVWDEARAHTEELIARYGLALADRYVAAGRFIELDVRRTKLPPTGWAFVDKMIAKVEHGDPMFDDAEKHQLELFWLWYMPVEAAVLELCGLIVAFNGAGPEHDRVLQSLLGVAIEMYARYSELKQDGRIVWLPQRIPVNGRRGTILQALNAHLMRFTGNSDAPPKWASERIPDAAEPDMRRFAFTE